MKEERSPGGRCLDCGSEGKHYAGCPQRSTDTNKVLLRGPRKVLGGLLLVITVKVLGTKTWKEIVAKSRREDA
jgi:hypothetical protein